MAFLFRWFWTLMIPVVLAVTPAEQARNDFTYQYEQFRSFYSDFQLKKAQYQTTATFAHEEELNLSAKTMLKQRDQLWWNYFQALKAMLQDNQGLGDDNRSTISGLLTTSQEDLQSDQQKLETINNRADLNAQAASQNGQLNKYQALTYSTLSALEQGRLIYAAQSLDIFGQSIRSAALTQMADQAAKEARIRGIDETLNILHANQQSLTKPGQTFGQFSQSYQPGGLYRDNLNQMTPSYTQIQTVFTRLKELSKDLTLE